LGSLPPPLPAPAYLQLPPPRLHRRRAAAHPATGLFCRTTAATCAAMPLPPPSAACLPRRHHIYRCACATLRMPAFPHYLIYTCYAHRHFRTRHACVVGLDMPADVTTAIPAAGWFACCCFPTLPATAHAALSPGCLYTALDVWTAVLPHIRQHGGFLPPPLLRTPAPPPFPAPCHCCCLLLLPFVVFVAERCSAYLALPLRLLPLHHHRYAAYACLRLPSAAPPYPRCWCVTGTYCLNVPLLVHAPPPPPGLALLRVLGVTCMRPSTYHLHLLHPPTTPACHLRVSAGWDHTTL